jgi:predicted TIM-barrel fold metal-dependent hydrolase
MFLQPYSGYNQLNCFANTSYPWAITLEEHWTSKAALPSEPARYHPLEGFINAILPQLSDLYDGRVADLDKNGIAIQVVSHSPGANLTNVQVQDANNELATAIKAHPSRLAGFALLPMSDPIAAIGELDRCINQLGFVGALVDNHVDQNFYDSSSYDPFWSRLVELDVPIYIHPTFPSQLMKEALYTGGGLSSNPAAETSIGTFGLGWHSSTANSLLRLLGAGVFDRHKDLKVIIGHTGETLPIMFQRIDRISTFWVAGRNFSDVMRHNVWITTSGMFDIPSLINVQSWMPMDRVMLSVDYPYSQNALARTYLNQIAQAGILSPKNLQDFACGNAQKLLFNRNRPRVL